MPKPSDVENCALGTLRNGYHVDFKGGPDRPEDGDRQWEAVIGQRGHHVNTMYGETLAELREEVQFHYGK